MCPLVAEERLDVGDRLEQSFVGVVSWVTCAGMTLPFPHATLLVFGDDFGRHELVFKYGSLEDLQ